MAVRSVKLKLVVPRRSDGLASARALWATHDAVNVATHRYESVLLLCRQRDYETGDGTTVTADEAAPGLDRLISEARRRNGYEGPKRLDETKEKLRRLYAEIVPSSVGKRGDANRLANEFLSPLADPKSRGLESIFDKIGDPPGWMEGVRAGEPRALDEAGRWLESPGGQERLRPTGSPTKWIRLAREKKPGWPDAFVADFDRKTEEARGAPTLARELRGLGVMPLFPAYFEGRIEGREGPVSPWDRLAMRLAVAHLLSWESWSARAKKEHDARAARLERFRGELEASGMGRIVEALRGYEKERREALREKQRGSTDIEADEVRVKGRTVRGWADLREKWLKKPQAGADERIAIVAGEQDRQRPGRFGDPLLFHWLARDERRFVWEDRDGLSAFVSLRDMEARVERSRDAARMTPPDARLHPRWTQWEPEGGKNLMKYRLKRDDEGRPSVVLPLLRKIGEDRYIEEERGFALAKSTQLPDVRLDRDGGKPRLTWGTPTGETAEAEVGSADLLMDRRVLERRGRERAETGDIGPAFLKVALEVRPVDPVGDPRRKPPAVFHFSTAAGKKTRHAGDVGAGFRVLSVDLGVRSLAACSVFELKETADAGKPVFPVDGLGLCAVHERSFLLTLPGERPGRRDLDWREEKDGELRRLRWALARYRNLRALDDAPAERRREALGALRERAAGDGWPFEERIARELPACADEPEPVWAGRLDAALRDWRGEFAEVVREWRRRNRARSEDKRSGKTMWAIRHLTDTRRFLQGWSLLSERGETRRHDRERSGVFARRLLDRIDALKEDRRKTGADLIVQAARGWRRDGAGRWKRAHAPCHVVLFEDLTRYRTRTDRPRRENDRLMQWAHRAIREETEMQAELHGVHVAEAGAAFSSRFHAATHAPGVRLRPLRERDLRDDWMLDLIEKRNPGVRREDLKPGDLVRMDGGELFACLAESGGATTTHADVNAAQNLQRRFFTRHGDAFRIFARKAASANGETIWLPRSPGKRLLGALGSHGVLVPTGCETDGPCRFERRSEREWKRLSGEGAAGDGDGEDDATLAGIEDALETTGEAETFFRDPSGVVLPADLWYPRKVFWSVVGKKTMAALRR